MISILCFDNIIMMSCFVELWHDIIENQWNPCFDFPRCDKINTLKSVGCNILMTGAVRVLPQCPMNKGNVCSVSGSSLGTTSFLMPISDSTMLIKLFQVVLLSPPPPIFGRNTCSWSGLSFHITTGLPINYRNKWMLLDRKVRSHFVRDKHY